jgi:adenosylhomocysteine nucleosidase
MSAPVLVCFAVPQEAKVFQKLAHNRDDVRVLITGMGARNAERSVRASLQSLRPSRAFSCGFAGALNPELKIGDVVFDVESTTGHVADRIRAQGAKPVSFICTERVAVTMAEKTELRASTKADAVEMESAVIHRLCREAGVECVTLRAISDPAHEDLPLDFNALMTREQTLSPLKLAWAILKAPQKIQALARLGKNSAWAAERLAAALIKAV